MSMDIVKERERVAEMCSWCDIDSYGKPGGGREYVARMWCNAIGDHVVGYGDTAWAAVQAAHAIHDMASK